MKLIFAVLGGKIGEILRPIFFVTLFMALMVSQIKGDTFSEAGKKDVIAANVATVNSEKNLNDGSIGTLLEHVVMTIPFSCPQDVYVNCRTYTGNPGDYGAPQPLGNYQITITHYEEDVQLNMCKVGHVIRRWTIQTQFGQGTCTQRITVSPTGNFGNQDITWPLDYDLGECVGSIHPDDLPPGYRRPTWINDECAMIGTSYHDQIVNIGGGGCKKILRTWKVIDWCTYQTNHYPQVGIWMHVQVIKLSDNEDPTITFCPDDITVSTDTNCTGSLVQIPLLVAEDNCTALPMITNTRTNGGANASGLYPLGTTTIIYTVRDDCGNTSTCSVNVTVRDQKSPTAIAFHGLIAVLMDMQGGPAIQVDAALFNRGSYDNCTPQSQLRFEIEPNIFDCENLGINDIRFIVYDESGNSDWVYTYIIIQENMGMCPDSIGGMISGLIQSEGGYIFKNLDVTVVDDQTRNLKTNQYGFYNVKGLRRGSSLEINPSRPGSLMEGVDMRDLVRLRRHITGEEPLLSAYRWLAADINQSGTVDYKDYLQLRMMLLMSVLEFPGLNSWRFIDKSLDLTDADILGNLKDKSGIHISSHGKFTKRIDFVAVKTGDVDGSVFKDLRAEERTSNNPVIVSVSDRKYLPGQLIQVPINLQAEERLEAFMLSFEIDQEKLELLDIIKQDMSENVQLEWFKDENGKVKLIVDFNEFDQPMEFQPISLLLKSRMSGKLSEQIDWVLDVNETAILNEDLEYLPIDFQFNENNSNVVVDETPQVVIYPNPAYDNMELKFVANTDQSVEIELIDMQGKLIQNKTEQVYKGENRIFYQIKMGVPTGVYFVRVKANDLNLSERVLIRN
jgi:hypothetical protein